MAENLESEIKIDARPTASQTEISVDAIPTVNQNLSSVQGCFEDNPGSNSNSQSHNDQSGRELFISRDEMNLVEFPLAVLSTRVNPKLKTLEFQDSQRLSSGQVIEREWIITGADKFGLPTSTDDDVVLALMRLTFENGFKNRKVYFTRYELLKILRWSTEGRSYRRLTKSLDRLSGVRIKASNAFFSNSDKAWQTRNFGLIDAYEINDGRNRKASAKEGSASLKSKKPTSFSVSYTHLTLPTNREV